MTISILTLFPEMFDGPFSHSIIKNAVRKGLLDINFVNIRDFGIGKHKVVDDKPYGGGKGMVLRVDVLHSAIEAAKSSFEKKGKATQKVILLDPAGTKYNQAKARTYAKIDHLIIVCGHYEGYDNRIRKFIDEEVSIGDFVLTGGEIPAMAIVDSVARLTQGVLPKQATEIESFSGSEIGDGLLLEYPQYTRPEKYNDTSVPIQLLSGNHQEVKIWREKQAISLTQKKRPDLLKG